MEKQFKTYESYPAWFVLVSNAITFSVYALGAYIISRLGLIYLIVYLLYLIFIEIRLLTKSCVDCYYYGKLCFLGRGMVASWFFKKGDSQRFISKQISWKHLVFDFAVAVVPLVIGIILLILNFNWPLLAAVILLVIMGFPVTGYLRSNLACRYCKQKEIGCPAEKMFSKKEG